jgi:hypothetical protein
MSVALSSSRLTIGLLQRPKLKVFWLRIRIFIPTTD